MHKLSIVIPYLNQYELLVSNLKQLLAVTSSNVEIILIDNGSDTPMQLKGKFEGIKVVRNEKNIGVYPTFKQGFDVATGDIVAFFHSDLVVWDMDWEKRILAEFENNKRLGMIGFFGSTEIDWYGGRGQGVTSNFQGRTLINQEGQLTHGIAPEMWVGSIASAHMFCKEYDGFTNASVIDGCAMIIRREAWNDIGYREKFVPHHFYDRLISCQLLEKKWDIGVLGIACDHFSGQTVGHEKSYNDMAEEWCRNNILNIFWRKDYNWDGTMYDEAERRFLLEYRTQKHLIPIKC